MPPAPRFGILSGAGPRSVSPLRAMVRALVGLVLLFAAASPLEALVHGGKELGTMDAELPKRDGQEGRAGSSRGRRVEARPSTGEERTLDSLKKEALSKMRQNIGNQQKMGAAVVAGLKNKVLAIKEGLPDLQKRVGDLAKYLSDGFHPR
uniref:Uncharacterized protein n=1 Tax=Alexandrium catenella TaxID=2925 RepID=A0A7S1W1F5_ALECA